MPLVILVKVRLETRALETVKYCKVNEHTLGKIENPCLLIWLRVAMISHGPRMNE